MLVGEPRGVTGSRCTRGAAKSALKSAWVRIRRPGWLSSIRMSNGLPGLGSFAEPMSISTTRAFPASGIAAAQLRPHAALKCAISDLRSSGPDAEQRRAMLTVSVQEYDIADVRGGAE